MSPAFHGWGNRLGGMSRAGPACGCHSHQSISDTAHAPDAATAVTPSSRPHPGDLPCAARPVPRLLATASRPVRNENQVSHPRLTGSEGAGGTVQTTPSLPACLALLALCCLLSAFSSPKPSRITPHPGGSLRAHLSPFAFIYNNLGV